MPELPEVETVRQDLRRLVLNQTVTEVQVCCPAMLVRTSAEDLQEALVGATLVEIGRQGKALILRFSSGYSLLVHFRMTGQLYPVGPEADLPEHTRTVLVLGDGRRLLHVDVRRLGTLELVPTEMEAQAATLAGLGPDALEAPPKPRELLRALGRRRISVKQFLLDQSYRAGVGNIYASEILARARIAPGLSCCRLTGVQARALLKATAEVLTEAVEARGTTVSDYRTGTGDVGSFQHHLRVYGREGQACTRRGCRGTIERIVQAQRSTYYCPVCQGMHQAGPPAPGKHDEPGEERP